MLPGRRTPAIFADLLDYSLLVQFASAAVYPEASRQIENFLTRSGDGVSIVTRAIRLFSRIQRQVIGDDGEFLKKGDVADDHSVRHFQYDWRKVQEGANARGDSLIGDCLRRVGGHGYDRDARLEADVERGQVADVLHFQFPKPLPDLLLAGVEYARDVEPLFSEAGITDQRGAEISGSEHDNQLILVDLEDSRDTVLQFDDVVAHAGLAEFSEIREVFSELRGVDSRLLFDLRAEIVSTDDASRSMR